MSTRSAHAPAPAAATDRWVISNTGYGAKPWVVTDTRSDPAEHPTLYRFSSRKKAVGFKDTLEGEAAKAAPVS